MSEHFSYDRHVDGDTKFTRGRWELKAGVKILWASDNVKTAVKSVKSVKSDLLYSVYSTRPITHRGDTLNNAVLTTNLTSPVGGVLMLEAYHNKSSYKNAKEPRFEVSSGETSIKTSETLIESDGLTATISPDRFSINFEADGVPLTGLSSRSLGYVEDSRYQKPSLTGHKFTDYMTCQLNLSVGEKIYGLGERYGAFVKNGQHVEMWNEDGGTSSDVTYKNVPFYLSSKGYGVFVDSTSNVNFEVQSERTTRVNITVQGQGIRIYIIKGPELKDVLTRYASLTGFPALPPADTFGLWLTTSFLTDYDYATVSTFLQGMKDRDIPLNTFHFDCFWMKGFQWCDFKFDPQFFPDAKKMLGDLKQKFDVKICVWINSYIAQESDLFDEADEQGYLIRKTDDGASYQCDLWQGGMGIVDFTNPEACTWYKSKLATLIDMGVDYFKTDFGERIPSRDVSYHDGSNPVGMHNFYTYLYNKCVFEVLEEKKGEGEACLFARSTTAGGQKFPVHWGGDCESSFEAMAESLRGGLSLSLCGFGYWSHDIGGFEGSPDPAVYKRWCAFGLMSSHSRLHGSHSYRVPWNFDDEASDVLRKFTKLKLSLMPYIWTKAVEAHATAVPVMRPMMLEFKDRAVLDCDAQFMLGDCLLVAPVFSEKGDVSYYIPKGDWFGILDGKIRHSSGEWVEEVHDFMSIPLLVKPNSVFVTALESQNKPDYAYNEDFLVNIYAVEGSQTVDIAALDGKIVASVTVESTSSGYTVSTSGNVGKYKVRVLGQAAKHGKQDHIGYVVDGNSVELV